MKRIKLHTKFIVLLTGVSLVPLIAVSSFTLIRFQQSLRTDASKLGEQLAATASAQIQTFLTSQFGVLDNIAAIYNPGFPIQDDVAADILETLLLKSDNFMDISVVDQDGRELVHKNRLRIFSEGDLRDMGSTSEFSVVRTAGVYVGPVYVESGRSFFDVGRAIFNGEGEFMGVVFAQLDARVMPSVVEAISQVVGPPGRVYIVDEKGRVIAHPDASYMLSERNLSILPPVASIVANPNKIPEPLIYENELGQSVLGAAFPMTIQLSAKNVSVAPSINWFVVAEQPEERVYADAGRAALFSILISLAGILLAAVSAIFFAGRIAKPIEALHTAAVEFGKGNLEYRADVKTGDEIQDLADSFNVTAEKLQHTVASLQNEERVTAAERNKLSVILSGITNAVVAVNMKREIILFNKAAETLTGVTTESVLGRQLGDVVKVFDVDREIPITVLCPVQEHAPEGIAFSANSLTLKDAGGSEHFINVVSGHIRDGENIDLGCVITFQDITREFIMERTKREFVSIAAHQLRTPLTGLSWTVEVLLSETKGALSAAQKELVERGLGAVHRMVELVDDLLNVSRIEEGRFGVKIVHRSIRPVLARALEVFKRSAAEKQVTLNTEIAEDLQDFDFDADKIEFVIGNLLDNAVKYTEKGGTVTLKVFQEPSNVGISIADTGIGIPKDDYGRIFSKFYRSREASSHFTDGSGIGLYVAKNIVDRHGGNIRFESEEGKGTTFTVLLPVSHLADPDDASGAPYTQPPENAKD